MEIIVGHRDEVAAVCYIEQAVVVVESMVRIREEFVVVDPHVRAFLNADSVVAWKEFRQSLSMHAAPGSSKGYTESDGCNNVK